MQTVAWATLVIATLIIAAAALGLVRIILHLRAVHITLDQVVDCCPLCSNPLFDLPRRQE